MTAGILSDNEVRKAIQTLESAQIVEQSSSFYFPALRTLSLRYRGKGRPRNSDYDYDTGYFRKKLISLK